MRRRLQDPAAKNSVSVPHEQPTATVYPYRRNRTLTGSLSSRVVSANEKSSELKSARVQSHDLHRFRRRLMMLLGIILSIAMVLGFLMYQSIAKVRIVSATQITHAIDSDYYNQLVNQYLDAHPLERFRFSLNVDGLGAYLEDNGAPEVASVSPGVSYDGFGVGLLSIRFREPVVSWTASSIQQFVDETGTAFTKNYYADPSVVVTDQSGISTKGNQVLVSNRFLGFMGKVIGQMKKNELEIISITIPADTTRQIAVNLKGSSYPIKFSTDRSAGEQCEDAARSVRYLTVAGVKPQYLDVRVKGKAFYK